MRSLTLPGEVNFITIECSLNVDDKKQFLVNDWLFPLHYNKVKKIVREFLQQCIALGILVFYIFSDKIF